MGSNLNNVFHFDIVQSYNYVCICVYLVLLDIDTSYARKFHFREKHSLEYDMIKMLNGVRHHRFQIKVFLHFFSGFLGMFC